VVTAASNKQPVKAPLSITVTELGMATAANDLQ